MLIAQLEMIKDPSTLARLAEPWNNLYSDSKAISSAVLFLHLVPLLVSGGAAIAADRATIRASRGATEDRTRQLLELRRIHVVVLSGLALSFSSGVLLFLSDVDQFLASPFFWVKLTLIGLLLANGFVMTRTESALEARGDEGTLWGRLRTISLLSLTLWLATTLAGVVLTNYA
ncbi:MAG: hypothetical protein JWL95_336 [Gemmatimonadetes bacterium]|nr:hypothetical protein [Gemmatimonadota bacterium]